MVVVQMEMPKSCPCELAGGYDIPFPCHGAYGIPKRCAEFDECVENGTKPDWCPIICALPEQHGRLVDADTLKPDHVIKSMSKNVIHQYVSKAKIDNAPTIVPATEGEQK